MSEYIKFNTTLSPGQKTEMRRAKQRWLFSYYYYKKYSRRTA